MATTRKRTVELAGDRSPERSSRSFLVYLVLLLEIVALWRLSDVASGWLKLLAYALLGWNVFAIGSYGYFQQKVLAVTVGRWRALRRIKAIDFDTVADMQPADAAGRLAYAQGVTAVMMQIGSILGDEQTRAGEKIKDWEV
jgi:hypothetical protein